MNYRERFFNAMDQKHVDRVPVGFWHHFFDENWTGINNINSHILPSSATAWGMSR